MPPTLVAGGVVVFDDVDDAADEPVDRDGASWVAEVVKAGEASAIEREPTIDVRWLPWLELSSGVCVTTGFEEMLGGAVFASLDRRKLLLTAREHIAGWGGGWSCRPD